ELPEEGLVRPVAGRMEGFVELLASRSSKLRGHLLPVFDAAVLLQHRFHPRHFALEPTRARLCKDPLKAQSVGAGHRLKGARQDQRAFTLPQIALRLLAIGSPAITQVQDVILDLKRSSCQKREGMKTLEVSFSRDQSTQAARVDEAVPARLLEDHREVVVFAHATFVTVNPAELHRLPFERF